MTSCCQGRCCQPAVLPVSALLLLVSLAVLVPAQQLEPQAVHLMLL